MRWSVADRHYPSKLVKFREASTGSNQVVAAPGDYGTLVRDLQKPQSERLALTSIIHGKGVAYSWANQELLSRKQKPLYCPPNTLAINAENHIEILLAQLRGGSKSLAQLEDEVNRFDMAAWALLGGLIATFPCK